jgi:hypothetical protein
MHREFLPELPPREQYPLLDAAVDMLPPATRRTFLSKIRHFGAHVATDAMAANSF